MAYKIVDVDPDDVLTDPGSAAADTTAPAAPAVPVVGPKNVYKKAAYTLPDITEADLPDIDIGQPAAAAKPAPKIIDVDPNDTLVNPSEVYKPSSDWDVTRGFKTAYRGMGESLLSSAEMVAAAGKSEEELTQWMLDRAKKQADPRNAQLQVKDVGEVDSLGKALTFGLESIGSMAGSVAGGMTYGGLPGAVIGGAAGSVLPGPGTVGGALTGFTAGTGAAFLGSGPGASLDSALQDAAIQKALADKTLSSHQLLGVTSAAGLAIGALDTFAPTKFLMKIAGKEVSKDAVKVLLGQAVKKGLLKGTVAEGGTETVQQTIDEVTQALEGGDIKAAERGMNILNAFVVGTIGGAPGGALAEVSENARIPEPEVGDGGGKVDEDDETTIGGSNPAVTPGVVAADAPGTGAAGGETATQAAPPVGAGDPAAAATVVKTAADDVDPTLKAGVAGSVGGEAGAGPQATRTDQPVIEGAIPEEEEDAGAPTATEAGQSELARLTREAIAKKRQDEAAKAQEVNAAATTVETGDIPKEVAAAVVAQQEQRTSKKTPRVKPQKVATAAMPADAAPIAGAAPLDPAAGVVGENLGTGVNLAPEPAAAAAPVAAAAQTPAETPVVPAQENIAALTPSVSVDAAPVAAAPLTPDVADAPVPDWMIENNKNAVTLADALGVTDMIKGMAERGITAKGISTALGGRLDVDQVRAVRDNLGIAAAGPKDFVGAEIPSSAPAPRAEVVKAVSRAKEPQAVAQPGIETVDTKGRTPIQQRAYEAALARSEAKKSGPTAKQSAQVEAPAGGAPAGEAIKQVSAERSKPALTIARKAPLVMKQRGKVIEAPKADKGVTYEAAKDVVVEERAPAAPSAPGPAPGPVEGKAKRNEVSDLVADEVHHEPDLTESRHSELAKPLVNETIRDVTAAFEAAMPKGRSIRDRTEALRGRMPEIIAEVKRRLEPDLAEHERQFRTAEEKRAEVAKERAAAESAKRAEQAQAETGQKKERAKKSGMSVEGLKEQSDDSVLSEEKLQLKKVPKLRDPLVLQHAQLIHEKRKKDTTAERKAAITELEKAVKEQRIAAAEAKAEAGPGLSEKHQEVEAKLEEATVGLDPPALSETDTAESHAAIAREHLAAFLKAIEGIEVAGRHDRVHNSPLENLAVFAHKLRKKDASVRGYGPGEFLNAHQLIEEGALEDFTNLVTNEKIKGSELREETTGKNDEDVFAADALEEGEVIDRTRRDELPEDAPTDLALRKGGRQGAVDRAQSEAARDDSLQPGGRDRVTTTDANGKVMTIAAETMSARQRLRQLGDDHDVPMAGFFGFFRNMHVRRLMQLVGDVPVHIVSDWDMQRITGTGGNAGVYRNYTDRDIARGVKPAVFISESAVMGALEVKYGHVLVHELTHAATVKAYSENIRGSGALIRRLRTALLADLRKRGHTNEQLEASGIGYGLFGMGNDVSADLEFIAEAFSNPQFQDLLASFNVDRALQADIAIAGIGRPLTWWSAFTRAVSNAIGMVRGARGQTYMDQVVALHPNLMRSSIWQTQTAKTNFGKMQQELESSVALPRAVPNGPADVHMLKAELGQRIESAKDWASSGSGTFRMRELANKFSTLGELKRKAAALMGGLNNAYTHLADILLRKDQLRAKFRKIGEDMEIRLAKASVDKEGIAKVSRNLHEASRFKVNHMEPLTHADNKHIPKTGAAGEARRKQHAKLAAEFATFSPQMQQLARDAAQHYREAWAAETKATVTYVVKAALKTYRARDKLPAGKTEQDVVNWVLDKGAVRKEDERTAEDKEFREALGSAADRLADITELRGWKGLYFPLARRGKWFVTATEKLETPAGAIADPDSQDGNRFLFLDEADAKAFTGSTDKLTNTTSRYVDEETGEKVKTKEGVYINAKGQVIIPVRQIIVTVQNKHMIMHDNRNTLLATAKGLADEGHLVSGVALTRKMMEENTHQDILPSQIATLLKHSEQTAAGSNTIGQQAVQDAIRESAIRAMTTPSKLTSHLKRTGQMGYSLDLVSAMREHNRAWASHMANMELAPEMADRQAELDKFINDRRRTQDVDELQQLKSELMKRFKELGKPVEEGMLSRFGDAVMNVSFMRHLFSPHYTIINLLQPLMTTYPVLAAEHGHAAAWSETIRFYRMGGVSKALGRGFSETFASGRNLNPYSAARVTDSPAHNPAIKEYVEDLGVQDRLWFDLTVKEDDAGELHSMYRGLIDRGFGATSGTEAGVIAEEEMNIAEKGLNRLATVAKGLPEAAESINRYHTATVAYRLARRKNMSVEDAQQYAWSKVEQTQGGYARANSPLMFNNPLLRAPLQFKKYGVMYGQLFYGNLAKVLAPSTDPETRKVAAKTLARLSLTTMAFAGVGGLPMIEVARMLANTAVLMGLSDDDWEDWENGLQEWFASLIGGAPAEALMHGATRLAGVDTSAAMGADNLVTFGQPKTLDEEGTMAWIGKMMIGASGGMAIDSGKALADGDILGAFPWPKVIKNMTDSYGLYNHGTVSRETGEQYSKPVGVGEAVTKALGFNPASTARQWEAKGSGRVSREDRQTNHQRTVLMGKWAAAKQRGDNAAAQRIFQEDVREWNAEHKDKRLRIDMGGLMKSRKERERRRKELEKSAS